MCNILSVSELHSLLGVKEDIGFSYITPNVAKEILEKNNKKNRPLKESKGNKLSDSFSRGEYFVSTCCIGFNPQGILVDGQHRLYAISKQNTGNVFKIGVMFNIEHNLDMDTGSKRTLVDNASISDVLDERLRDKKACLDVAKDVCYYARGYYLSRQLTQKQQVEIANSLADDLLVCYNAGLFDTRKNGTSPMPVRSAFFLAYVNGVDIKYLIYIKDKLKSSKYDSDYDKPILGLTKRLACINGGGREPGIERFLLACECIYRVSHKQRGERYDSYEKLVKSEWRYKKKDIPHV